jgi:hypothetical protein
MLFLFEALAAMTYLHTVPLFSFIFTLIEQTYNIYMYILLVENRPCYPHCFRSEEGLLWGAEPRFEFGAAVHQADALLSYKPRRTR